jgi:hypothetical protein
MLISAGKISIKIKAEAIISRRTQGMRCCYFS